MEERYCRNVPALTREECARLREKTVLIAGCGGLGGYLLDLLLRIGIGCIRVCDGDVFEASNLNRQLLAEPGLLGTSKAEAARAYAARVNPDVSLEAFGEFLTRENAHALVAGCDAVLDGLDSIASRRLLRAACDQGGIPYIFGAVSGWVAQGAVILPGEPTLDILYPQGAAPGEKTVLSFTPAICAGLQASLCVKLLSGRPVESGKLYHWDLLNLEWEGVPVG